MLKLNNYAQLYDALNQRDSRFLPSSDRGGTALEQRRYLDYLHTALEANPKVIDDVIKYPAAASAVLYITDITHNSDRMIKALATWRSLYAYRGKAVKALNVTLDLLGHLTPHQLAKNLSGLPLRHAIVDPLRLNLALVLPDIASRSRVDQMPNLHQVLSILYHTHDDDITEAMQLIAEYSLHQPTVSDINGLTFAVTLLRDGMQGSERTLSNAARNSIRAHREDTTQAAEQLARQLNLHSDSEVAIPREALPTQPGIRMLKTVGEIVEEGRKMGHCVGSYAPNAVTGRSLLFHVEYDNEHATFEINAAQQRVVQYAGPHNIRSNKAISYGEPILSAWARTINPLKLIIPPDAKRLR